MLTKDDVVSAISEALEARRGIDDEQHHAHHSFIQEWIEHEHRKRESREKIKQQVFGWGIVTLLSGIGYAAYQGFLAVLKRAAGN